MVHRHGYPLDGGVRADTSRDRWEPAPTPTPVRKRLTAEQKRLIEVGRKYEAERDELLARTPNPDVYDILEIEEVGSNLVAKVKYSGCADCSFDSCKVMVWIGVSLKDAVRWRRIDPHFTKNVRPPSEAPCVRARFPADDQGWKDALAYAS